MFTRDTALTWAKLTYCTALHFAIERLPHVNVSRVNTAWVRSSTHLSKIVRRETTKRNPKWYKPSQRCLLASRGVHQTTGEIQQSCNCSLQGLPTAVSWWENKKLPDLLLLFAQPAWSTLTKVCETKFTVAFTSISRSAFCRAPSQFARFLPHIPRPSNKNWDPTSAWVSIRSGPWSKRPEERLYLELSLSHASCFTFDL